MNFITSPLFKLLVYVLMTIGISVASLKDIDNSVIATYTWWNWALLLAGLLGQTATNVLAFLNQSIARNDGNLLNKPQPSKVP